MSLHLLRTRLARRLMVAAQLLALLLAGGALFSGSGRPMVPLEIGLWGEIAAGAVLSLLALSSGFNWNQPRRDERQRQRWLESQAFAYRALMLLFYPVLFWFAMSQLRSGGWTGSDAGRMSLVMGILLIVVTSLPVAVAAWREPDLADE